MIRNFNTHFALNPEIADDVIRSKFHRTNRHLTTANAGQIIPIYVDEMYPGDTYNMKTTELIRQMTPIHATMDDVFLDTYSFFVPWRLVWEHFQEFMGENTVSAYEQPVEYTIPQITAPEGGWQKGSLADYMGIPIGIENISVSSLPFRVYAKINNDWFRDENLVNPCFINLDDATVVGSNGSVTETDVQLGGMPAIAAKLPDYFTTCLPQPQKGPDVLIPLLGEAPVLGNGTAIGLVNGNATFGMTNTDGTLTGYTDNYGDSTGILASGTKVNNGKSVGLSQDKEKSGIIADLSQATSATIIQLRQAFAIQSFYEKDARGGTRYIEIIRNHFGVTSSDARLQRPEYIGGKRISLNMQQVIQTSATDSVSPQGNVGGFSYTTDDDQEWTYSAEEHGCLMTLAVIRYQHSYQQGIERFWTEKDKFDKYWSTFNGIGDQAVLVKEIFAQGTSADDEVFGYQERYGHLRYKPNRISGAFRSTYAQSLDAWHLGDNYESQPILGPDWIKEDKTNIDRTIAVTSELENQFLLDFWFDNVCIRPMPAYSIPGMRTYL